MGALADGELRFVGDSPFFHFSLASRYCGVSGLRFPGKLTPMGCDIWLLRAVCPMLTLSPLRSQSGCCKYVLILPAFNSLRHFKCQTFVFLWPCVLSWEKS